MAAVTSRGWTGESLTAGERRVVAAMCVDGASNAELAAQLFVEQQTIKFHLGNVMAKAGVTNRTALALWWIRRGQYLDIAE